MAWMPALGAEGWQYKEYSTQQERDDRCKAILVELIEGRINAVESAADTRPVHRRLFLGMYPAGFDSLAGTYRGTKDLVLQTYNVRIPGDDKVGVHFSKVHQHMATLEERIRVEVRKHDQLRGRALTPQELFRIVGLACSVMVRFLTIHPYADGNGHVGRFLIWALLHHFGIHARRWPLEQRPRPNYFDKITAYRANDKAQLINFVLDHIAEPGTVAAVA